MGFPTRSDRVKWNRMLTKVNDGTANTGTQKNREKIEWFVSMTKQVGRYEDRFDGLLGGDSHA